MTSRSVRDLASGMTPLGTILAYAAAAAEAGKKAAQERSRGRRADISGEEDDIDKHVRWWEGAQPVRPSSTEQWEGARVLHGLSRTREHRSHG
jgi:hypothetical protein